MVFGRGLRDPHHHQTSQTFLSENWSQTKCCLFCFCRLPCSVAAMAIIPTSLVPHCMKLVLPFHSALLCHTLLVSCNNLCYIFRNSIETHGPVHLDHGEDFLEGKSLSRTPRTDEMRGSAWINFGVFNLFSLFFPSKNYQINNMVNFIFIWF